MNNIRKSTGMGMKILQLHNEYLFPGGEDAVAVSESIMLRAAGHEIVEYRRSNSEIGRLGALGKFFLYFRDIYFSRRVYDEVAGILRREKPDVAHFHNSFFMIGPAAYEACFDAGIPVVQTLHNFRFLCAAGTFFRSGKVCEECLLRGRSAGVGYGCWHGSHLATALMTSVIRSYEKRGILRRIKRFVALNDFCLRKFVANGFDPMKVVVKPNFLEHDLGMRTGVAKHVLCVGALMPYKGVKVLLEAWASRVWPVPLKIAGTGPLEATLKDFHVDGVEWLGQCTQDEVLALMKEAVCIVVPSQWYENFPRVIIEAYACGVPVVASRLGAMCEIVEEGETGYLFDPGDAQDLALKIKQVCDNPSESLRMGGIARKVFENKYTADINYNSLMDVYRQAMAADRVA